MDGWMHEWMVGWMHAWMHGWMGGWMDGCMNGWMDGWMGGWMDWGAFVDVVVCEVWCVCVASAWRVDAAAEQRQQVARAS